MKGLNPEQIAEKTKEYERVANYVLIDPSGGRGDEFDIIHSVAVYQELQEKIPLMLIGFAGGFNGHNVRKRIQTLTEMTGAEDFCIEAEGGLRDKITDRYGDDILSLDKVKQYIYEVKRVLP